MVAILATKNMSPDDAERCLRARENLPRNQETLVARLHLLYAAARSEKAQDVVARDVTALLRLYAEESISKRDGLKIAGGDSTSFAIAGISDISLDVMILIELASIAGAYHPEAREALSAFFTHCDSYKTRCGILEHSYYAKESWEQVKPLLAAVFELPLDPIHDIVGSMDLQNFVRPFLDEPELREMLMGYRDQQEEALKKLEDQAETPRWMYEAIENRLGWANEMLKGRPEGQG